VPSMVPLMACDCAMAGAASASASSATTKFFSMNASIPRENRGDFPLAVESERGVAAIHFLEVLAQQNAAREVRAGDAVAAVAERKQVMREISMCADVRES